MLWAPINLKLRHLFKIILTYIAFEANVSVIINYLNWLPLLTTVFLLTVLL